MGLKKDSKIIKDGKEVTFDEVFERQTVATIAKKQWSRLSWRVKDSLIGIAFLAVILTCITVGSVYWGVLGYAMPYKWYCVFVPYIIAVVAIVLLFVWMIRDQCELVWLQICAGIMAWGMFFVLIFGIASACIWKEDGIDIYENGIFYSIKEDGTLQVERHWNVKYEMEKLEIPEQVHGRKVTSIGEYAFWSTSLKEVVLSDSIITIGDNAFSSCGGLESLVIGNGVTKIDNYTFYGCSSLKKLVIGNNVESIGDYAFSNCRSLEKVVIGNKVTNLNCFDFQNNTNLQSVVIGNGVTSIGDRTFRGCSSLISITIPDSITEIGEQAFCGCKSLTSITIPKNVVRIGYTAFNSCHGLETVYWNATACYDVDSRNHASPFWACERLTTVIIGDNVTSIPSYAFYSGHHLTSVTLGQALTTIGARAFQDCYNLIEIANNSNISLEKGSSLNGGIAEYALNIYSSPYGNSNLSVTDDGYVFYCDYENGALLVSYVGKNSDLVLPADFKGVKYAIKEHAFCGLEDISSIDIGDGIVAIGEQAFAWCSNLKSVVISNNVENVGDFVFAGCTNLEKVMLGNGIKNMGIKVFESCAKLTSIVYKGTFDDWSQINKDGWNYDAFIKDVYCNDGVIILNTES